MRAFSGGGGGAVMHSFDAKLMLCIPITSAIISSV